MATPPGWKQDSENPNRYNATFPFARRGRQAARSFTLEVDNNTGLVSIIDDNTGVNFQTYDPNSGWRVTEGADDTLLNAMSRIGPGGLTRMREAARKGAAEVVKETAKPEVVDGLEDTDG